MENGSIKGRISCGFEFDISKERFQNYKTLKMLKAADKDPSTILDVVPRILGDEQEEKLIEALGGDPGFDDVIRAMKEIFDAAKEDANTKKSSSLPN